jgi:mono/diheme cytochrome c family protein
MLATVMRAVLLIVACACGADGKRLPLERAAESGTALYSGYAHANVDCYRCHGAEGAGTKRGDSLVENVPKMSDVDIRRTITWGVRFGTHGGMPGFGDKLTPAEIDTLEAWMCTRFRCKRTGDLDEACASDDDCVVVDMGACCGGTSFSLHSRKVASQMERQLSAAGCDIQACERAVYAGPGAPRCRAQRCDPDKELLPTP